MSDTNGPNPKQLNELKEFCEAEGLDFAQIQALYKEPEPEIDFTDIPKNIYQGSGRLDLSDAAIYGGRLVGISPILSWLGGQIAMFAFNKIAEWGYSKIFKSFSTPDDGPKLKDVMDKLDEIQLQLKQMNETLGKILAKLEEIIKLHKLESVRNHLQAKQEKYLVLAEAVNQAMANLTEQGVTEARQREVLSYWYNTPLNGSQNALQATIVYAKTIMDTSTNYDMYTAYDKFIELSNYGWEKETYAFREMMRDCDMALFLNCAMLTSLYLRSELDKGTVNAKSDIELLNQEIKKFCKYYDDHKITRLPEGINRFVGNQNNLLLYGLTDVTKKELHRDGFTKNPRTWKGYFVDWEGKNRTMTVEEVKEICKYYQNTKLEEHLAKGGFILPNPRKSKFSSFVMYHTPCVDYTEHNNICIIWIYGMLNISPAITWPNKIGIYSEITLQLADNGTKYVKTVREMACNVYSLFIVDPSLK